MLFESRKNGDIVIYKFTGEMVFDTVARQRPNFLQELDQINTEKLVLDLTGTQRIDSAGIGFLVSVYKKFKARHKTSKKNANCFALINRNKVTDTALQAVGLTKLVNIFDSEEEAVKFLS